MSTKGIKQVPNPQDCRYCGRTSPNPQGRGAHEKFCKDNPNRATTSKRPVTEGDGSNGNGTGGELVVQHRPKTSERRRQHAEVDLLAFVMTAFPKGVPTNDPAQLADDLAWIGHTSTILERR